MAGLATTPKNNMNFQQLRSVREAVRCGFNLTEAAHALHTSQPGVSRQIRELEEELGVSLFARAGKRLTGLTSPGSHLLPIIERVLLESHNLRQAGQEFAGQQDGQLSVAATHSQARYAMPLAVQEFRALFPGVKLHLHQGSPKQIAQMLLDAPLTLEALAQYPLITYDTGFTGRTRIDAAFDDSGIAPQIVLTAMDADVIKTYVQLGMGVGIVAGVAYEAERDTQLRAVDAGPLFGINTTKLAVRRGSYLRGYVYAFIEAFAPTLTRSVVDAALDVDPVPGAVRAAPRRDAGAPAVH
jgi:LysR family cys regulon transcriptional activator